MKSFITILFFLLIAVAGIYFFNHQLEEAKELAVKPGQEKAIQLPQAEEPKIKHPIPEPTVALGTSDTMTQSQTEDTPEITEVEEPLPTLDQSDGTIKQLLVDILKSDALVALFRQTGIIHRFVVTIDTLPQQKMANKFRLIQPAAGKFLVIKDADENITIDPKNSDRYRPFMQILQLIDTEQFVTFYTRYYPLLQEAYDALGYKERYFNDRFIEVIDHLLATPDIEGPISLQQPKVFYVYADPALESLSAGQKILLRIGASNSAILRDKLIAIRAALASPPAEE